MSTPRQTNQPQEPKSRTGNRTMTYVGTIILLVIVIVAFVGTPAVTKIASGNRISFGSYAGREIDYETGNFLARQYQNIAESVQQQQQDTQITDTLVRQIWRSAFMRTVYHEALLVMADKAGVSVSSDAVDRAIAQWPDFQDSGRFSASKYNSASTQTKFALRDYLKEVLIDSQVQSDLYGDPAVSDAEKQFLVNMAGPERQFRFVQFGYDDYPDSEVVAYGQNNVKRFQRADLSVITINSSQADAERIREQAVSRTSSFEDLARNQSQDSYATDGGEMGWVYYNELEPDFEDTSVIDDIFALPEGEISKVFKTTYGWTIYRVNKAPIQPDFTDTEVVGAVRKYMDSFERGVIEDYLTAKAKDFATSARLDGFDAAASTANQTPQTTGYFPINYGNSNYFDTVSADSNQSISTAAYREDFFTSLFKLKSGEVSDPIVIRDYVIVFQLADERDAPSSQTDLLSTYASSIVAQLIQTEAQNSLVDDSKLVDNFNSTYNRSIAGK